MPWTQFMDMHSGGGQKLDWAYIYIEASEDEARRVFFARFGRNPNNVTCSCCGDDYSVSEYPSLEEATAFNRGLRSVRGEFNNVTREWEYPNGKAYLEPHEPVPAGAELSGWARFREGNGQPLASYLMEGGRGGLFGGGPAHFIYAKDITDAERKGPKGGYQRPSVEDVWED